MAHAAIGAAFQTPSPQQRGRAGGGRRSRRRSRRRVVYYKYGWIGTYSLDAAYLHDPATNTRFLLVVAAKTGEREVIQQMAKRIAEWVKGKTEIQQRAKKSGD